MSLGEGDDVEVGSFEVETGGLFELGEDVLDLLFARALGYPESLCDPAVRLPLGHERKYLVFSWRERVEGGCPPSGREQLDDELGVEDGAAFADARERFGEFSEVRNWMFEGGCAGAGVDGGYGVAVTAQ